MLQIRWHGRGGQGAFTAARLLGWAVSVYEGKYAQAFPLFGPERRGAPVLSFTKIADEQIHDRSDVQECDYVVVLDNTLFGPNVTEGLKPGGILIINSESAEPYESKDGSYKTVAVDATKIAIDVLKKPITNIPMLAALVAAVDVAKVDSVHKAIADQMAPALQEKNTLVFDKVYEAVKGGN